MHDKKLNPNELLTPSRAPQNVPHDLPLGTAHERECDLQCRIQQLQMLVAQLLAENESLRRAQYLLPSS